MPVGIIRHTSSIKDGKSDPLASVFLAEMTCTGILSVLLCCYSDVNLLSQPPEPVGPGFQVSDIEIT